VSAAQWDQRYADDHYHYGTAPNAWLISQAWRLPRSGAALALADGEGRKASGWRNKGWIPRVWINPSWAWPKRSAWRNSAA